MQFSWKNPLKALPVLMLLAAYAGAALGAAGNVQFVIGDVKLIRAGATQALQKGAEVNEGDRIVTGAGASAQVKMVDGGFIAIRPNTDMGFDTYRYSGKEDGSENALVSLVRGGFRTITGVIGRTNKQNYLIRTETATIGIRGTDHEPMVILPPAPGQVAVAAAGTYDKVNVGVAFIRTDAGSVDIQRNQVGFAPVSKAAPVILPRIPPFYKPTPAPGPQKAKEEAATETAAAPAGGAAAAPAETAAAAPAAEASAQFRDTAVVDPASTITAAPAPAPIATAPAAVAPVVEITATSATGEVLNTTTQTQTTASGTTAPITAGPVIGSPIIASSNYGYGVIGAVPITGGVEILSMGSQTGVFTAANTNFVLSDNKLVEILQSQYQRFGLSSSAPVLIANANVKFTGGTAADVFSDPNGTYYMGRWSGGQIDVTDLATTGPVAPFSDALGVASAHWLLGLTPGILAGTSINNVQQLYGQASYSLAAATHPTDGFGNVGTLNSATLAADFSAQTVDSNLSLSFSSADPANLSTRNLSLAAAAKMQMQKSGFGAAVIAPQGISVPGISGLTSVSCSGADCAAGGYIGTIGGGFGGTSSGAVGTSVGLNYGFTAIPTSGSSTLQPFEDYISGAVVLSTAAAPTAGTSAVPVTGGTGSYRHFAFGEQLIGTTTYHSGYSLASGTTMSAQNYVFDASGNLVRMHNSNYGLSERGTSGPPSYTTGAPVPYTGTPGGLPTSPLTAAMVSFSGGTTPDGNYNDSVNGIRMGRYAGGTITTTDLSTSLTYTTPLGSNSYNWTVRELPASIPTTGSFEYATAYATKPTDSLGNVGTLNYASLSADFSKQTVSPAVGITINNQNLSSAATNVPIGSSFGFDVSSSTVQTTSGGIMQVKCFGSNCAPAPVGGTGSYGARITGGLAGSGTAGGAFFRYLFVTRYDPGVAAGSTGGIPTGQTRPVNDYIQGGVAFTKGASILAPAPATAASGNQSISTMYFTLGAGGFLQSWNQDYRTSPTSYTSPFGAGSPNSVADYDPNEPTPHSETITGGTVATPPTDANSAAATGVSFGRYTGGTVSGIDWKGNAFSQLNQGSYVWVKGPELFPYYLGGAMTGTAKYVLDGGTPPAGTSGSTGTLNSAVLAVDFNRAAVGVDLSVTASGATFTATSTSSGVLTGNPSTTLRLNGDNGFFGNSFSTNPALHESLYVRLNNTAQPYYVGMLRGQLTGPGLNGGGMTYAFQDNFTSPGFGVSGAVAFALDSYTNTSNVTTTGTSAIDPSNVPYLLGLMATGLIADPTASPANAPASVDSDYLTRINGGFNSSFRVPLDAVNGVPTVMDGEIPITVNPTCSPTPCPAYVSNTPARFSILPTSFVATGATPGSGQVALPAGKVPATLLESGRDATSGISWGRYGGGVIAVFDRIGGGFAPITVDLTKQNWHGIFSPPQTGPMVLPTTGTFTYTKIGGTSPTDNLGSAAGTLNAATLVADFAAQTVNAGVNLTVNGQTWAAGANAIPIQNRLYFQTGRDSTGGPMNVCVGGTCGTVTIPTSSSANTAGQLTGAFTGSSGQGAGMAYSLNQGGVTGTTVSGVAAFKR